MTPAHKRSDQVRRINLLGCPIDCLDMSQTLQRIETFIKEQKNCQHVVVNVSKYGEMRRDPQLREIISRCDIINADGMAVVWASRILGSPLPERVAGVDLFQNLVALCARKGYRPFFFGARQWVVEKTVEEFQYKYPELQVAGFRNGYFTPQEEPQIAKMIRSSRADMLFVGFSSPMKEHFLEKWIPVMKVPFCMGVGGSFDVVAGKTKRAPMWMQQAGLEWLYRLLQEPRRMWRRYLITNPIFVWMVFREYLRLARTKRLEGKAGQPQR